MSIQYASRKFLALATLTSICCLAIGNAVAAQPVWLKDRGAGVTTSLFGTYITKDEWLVYPFYEYIKATREEYHGSELNGVGETDYLGELEEHELGLFIAYGIDEDLAIEFEAIVYGDVRLDKAADDNSSGIPNRISESGFGSVETNLRWRIRRETAELSEIFLNFEIEYPLQKNSLLLGAQDWEFSVGIGRVKGYSWGTLTPRISIAYDRAEDEVKIGEYALEYLDKVSDSFRWVATLEGEESDVSMIFETQWRLNNTSFWKIGSGFGVTGDAEDFSPEIGLMMSF